jgi:hypothetical protein
MLEAGRQLRKITAATASSPGSPSPSSASCTVTRLRSHASLRESVTGPPPKFPRRGTSSASAARACATRPQARRIGLRERAHAPGRVVARRGEAGRFDARARDARRSRAGRGAPEPPAPSVPPAPVADACRRRRRSLSLHRIRLSGRRRVDRPSVGCTTAGFETVTSVPICRAFCARAPVWRQRHAYPAVFSEVTTQ